MRGDYRRFWPPRKRFFLRAQRLLCGILQLTVFCPVFKGLGRLYIPKQPTSVLFCARRPSRLFLLRRRRSLGLPTVFLRVCCFPLFFCFCAAPRAYFGVFWCARHGLFALFCVSLSPSRHFSRPSKRFFMHFQKRCEIAYPAFFALYCRDFCRFLWEKAQPPGEIWGFLRDFMRFDFIITYATRACQERFT